MLLENTRFEAGETKNDPELAKALASMAELYVSDAFGTVHRAHASTAGVAAYLPAVSGLLVAKELEVMGKALDDPKRPFVAVLGGAKVSDKIAVINNLLDKADTVIIGGGMAYTFTKAQGGEIGTSLLEEDKMRLRARDDRKGQAEGRQAPAAGRYRRGDGVCRRLRAPGRADAMHIPADCDGPGHRPGDHRTVLRRPSRAPVRSSGTARWACLSSRPLPPARKPWRRRWQSPAR